LKEYRLHPVEDAMAHTLLAQRLQHARSVATEAQRRQVEVDRVIADRTERSVPRHGPAELGAAMGSAGAPDVVAAGAKTTASEIRIAVVGAGLAGLTCAHRLKQAGYRASLYEASNRVGGRSWTLRDGFAEGQLVERGGQFIDSGHKAIRTLVKDLGLELDDVLKAEPAGTAPCYFFDGVPYLFAQASEDFQRIWETLRRDLDAAGYPTLHDSFTARGQELDNMSITDYIEQNVPGGGASKLGQLLEVAYTAEYGGEASEQSSLNMLYLLADQGAEEFSLLGPSDERYVVRGGCDQIPTLLAGRLSGQVETDSELVAIRRNGDGTVALSFDQGWSTKVVTADKVVLALPFSILRSSVDLSRAGFKPLKETAIRELGMGTSSKLHLQFTDRHWTGLGCNGETFTDTGYQGTWDESRAQQGRSGMLVNYTGGETGAGFGMGTPSSQAHEFLQQLEQVLPGVSAKWNGKVTIDHWLSNPWAKGSYSFWKVGQYTRFAGVEREREGNCHFAGEHTSVDFQGYLNGAVESGQRAADEVLQDCFDCRSQEQANHPPQPAA